MPCYTAKLEKRNLIDPPKFLACNVHYETMMGSVAYGVSSDTSDMDIYGFCIPPKNIIFPHLDGEIQGFGDPRKRFDNFQAHHIIDRESRKEYDLDIYNIVRYFHLIMGGNPNMIDSLFTHENCVLHITSIGTMVRENRKLFLSKKVWHTFKGYAYTQLHKIKTKNAIGKRKVLIDKYGYDVKFAYHTVRLMNQVEQILEEGDLDLYRSKEQLKSIRRGEWKLEDIERYFSEKQTSLERLYEDCELPHVPKEAEIKTLLLNILEHHYGSLSKAIKIPDRFRSALVRIESIISETL